MADQNYSARAVTVNNPQPDSSIRLPGWMVYTILVAVAFLVASNLLLFLYVFNVERRIDREMSERRHEIIQLIKEKNP